MKINIILSLALTVIIGISLIPLIGSLSNDALSGQTEIINVEKNIVYEDLPIQIKAGDTFVTELPAFRSNILYTIYIQNGETPASRYGFATTSSGRDIYINNVPYRFESGTWDAPAFETDFSNEWFTWVVVGTTGTMTFLQDFPVELDTIRSSTDVTYTEYPQPTSYSTDVLSTTEEVPVYTTTDRLVNLIPFFAVLILIGAVIVYIKFEKE